MPFDSFPQFRSFLNSQAIALTGKEASTNKVPKRSPNLHATREAWWRSTGRTDGNSDASLRRNRAYLRAYVEAAGEVIPAVGVRLGDGAYVWPDRSVMSDL